jgi:LAS superfamily LD-carboxypeptidase LdcB
MKNLTKIFIYSGLSLLAYSIIKKITKVEKKTNTWDIATDEKIKKLHPKVRQTFTDFVNTVQDKLNLKIRMISGLRTFAEQTRLYNQGRITAGAIVTKAPAGSSYHNYGLAGDFYIMKGEKNNIMSVLTPEVAKIANDLGLEWAGTGKVL